MLVVIVGAVAAFAIYTFEWRGNGASSERARAYAEAVAATCEPEACEVGGLTRISENDWKIVLRNPGTGSVGCALLQTDRFAQRADGDFAGASRMGCAEAHGRTTRGLM